jgi:LysM repeat protein
MNKKDFIKTFTFTFTFTLIMTFLIIAILSPSTVYSNEPINFSKVVVRSGDSLWTIASNNNSANKDIRELIYQIRMLNDIGSSPIKPGDILKVPVFD